MGKRRFQGKEKDKDAVAGSNEWQQTVMKHSNNRCSILKQANRQSISWFLRKRHKPSSSVCTEEQTRGRSWGLSWQSVEVGAAQCWRLFTGYGSAVLWECKFHTTLHLNAMSSPWVFGMAVLKGSSENPVVFDKYMPCVSLGLSRGTNKEAPRAQRR